MLTRLSKSRIMSSLQCLKRVHLGAIDPETGEESKEVIRKNLLKYCKHDTEAMVKLVHFFAGIQPSDNKP